MNYVRRPNRPDGTVYREMRRQQLTRRRSVVGIGLPLSRQVALAAGAALLAVLLVWMLWR